MHVCQRLAPLGLHVKATARRRTDLLALLRLGRLSLGPLGLSSRDLLLEEIHR